MTSISVESIVTIISTMTSMPMTYETYFASRNCLEDCVRLGLVERVKGLAYLLLCEPEKRDYLIELAHTQGHEEIEGILSHADYNLYDFGC